MQKTCSEEGCKAKYYAKGYCEKHWKRIRTHGNLDIQKFQQIPIEAKFERAIDKNGASVTPVGTPCWLWTEGVSPRGYGKVWWKGKTECSSRVAWMIYKGPIPDSMLVLHKCDTPSCVNPEHLFLGNHKINAADKVAKGRAHSGDHHGEKSGRAKLTETQVKAIRSDPRRHGPVAHDYGVDPSTICDIRNRKLWAHI